MFKLVDMKTNTSLGQFATRDGLFAEVENLQAKSKYEKKEAFLKLQQFHQQTPEAQAQLVDETALTLPFEGYIEEVLAHFGHKAPKKSRGLPPILKGLLNLPQKFFQGLGNFFQLLFKSSRKGLGYIGSRCKAILSRFQKKSPALPYETASDSLSTRFSESSASAPAAGFATAQSSLYSDPLSLSEEAVENPELDGSPESFSDVPGTTKPAAPAPLTSETVSDLAAVTARDVHSLSTYDLKVEFMERIEQETAQINREIAALEKKRQEHHLLLNTLNQLHLE